MSINNVSEYKNMLNIVVKNIDNIDIIINILNDKKQKLINEMNYYNSLIYECCEHEMIIDYIDEKTHTVCVKCGMRT